MKPGEVPPGPWDPGLLKDDDGQLVPLLGSVERLPDLRASKIAFEDGKLIYKGTPTPLFKLHPDQHGWERFGQDHSGLLANGQPTKPYMEGAWMTKPAAAITCSTERRGPSSTPTPTAPTCRTSRSGRSPTRRYNPIAYKPGGFVAGRGPRFDLPGRATAIGGTRARRGSATTGRSSGASTCCRRKFYPDGQMSVSSRFARFSALRADDEVRRPRQSVHRLDAAVVQEGGERFFDHGRIRPRDASPTKTRAPSGSRPPTSRARR